jgi:NADH-quinone oxidoreductase subunit H
MGSRAFLIVVPALLVTGAILTVAVALLLPPVLDFIGANLPLARFVAAAAAIIVLTIPAAFVIIYMELKVIAAMNLRVGPDRVGPYGSFMSVNMGLKVLAKEDFTPCGVDVPVFTLAPVVVFATIPLTLLVIPFAPGVFGQDFNIALLYFFAVGGMSIVGLMMAGWASFNKYSLLGALRAAAQAISYELPLTLSVVGIIILAGTMSLNSIVQLQAGSFLDWNIWKQPLGFIIFFIAATAEANRTPLDMTEADQELVGGFATEYSGMRFGFFFFAEYVNVIVVSALSVVLFFGGWNAPFEWPFAMAFNLDPGGLGLGLVFLIALAPIVGTIILGLPFWLLSSRVSTLQGLVIGFVLFNLLVVGAFMAWAFVSAEWVSGLVWMLLKTFAFVFLFVQMRGTLPRVRVDQLMSFAWKWLLPASLLNIFVTAIAVSILANR